MALNTDIAIIGAGAAGLSAAAAAAAQGLQVLVIERMGAGGQVMNVENIANWPGQPDGISGFELGPLLQEQAEEAGAQFLLDTVLSVTAADGGVRLQCEGETVQARALIVAAGSARRKLEVPGEEQLEGRGVSHCASCDGPLFRGQAVCVVGGGDSAFGEAAVLATHAAHVTLVFREAQPHAQAYLQAALQGLPHVTLLPGAEVLAIEGTPNVSALRVRVNGEERGIPCEGVFVYAGLRADSGFLAGTVARDEEGRIRTDDQFRTSLPGVFAAGDIRSGAGRLLADAARDGIAAAQRAARHLNERQETRA
ncbi:NAD(P)/FAD-dependent oxidoreductase [Ramlibacter sp. XY19]|uniref:NAD(P)/FAD-dependent oxidoreductase n=1 Tax=Ramlibacter paludis TaxID=2908000 RepID=UPI0023DB0B2D|nr:FAD-dependent oxidoreductase [Ramlibacter paludis]MCG2594360.1 NAD(P)/FAD-dependent oxidoreductase [Ramlibacter paludis]